MSTREPDELGAWPGLRLSAPLTGGNRVAVFRGEIDGAAVIARRSDRSHAALEWELDLLEHLGRRGVRAPQILRTGDGQRQAGGWYVHRFLEGRTATDQDAPAPAEAVAQVHRVTAGWPQRPGFAAAGDLLTQLRGGDVDLSAMPDHLVRRIRAAWSAATATGRAVVHGDLGPGNAIIGPDGRATLIDWDEARVDDPGFDVGTSQQWRTARLAWEIATCWVTEPEYAHGLVGSFLAQQAE